MSSAAPKPRTASRVSRLSEALDAYRAEQRVPTQAELAANWRADVLAEFRSDPRLTVKAVVAAIHGIDPRVKPPAFSREIARLLAEADLGRRRPRDIVNEPTPDGTPDTPPVATVIPDAVDDLLSQIQR